MGVWKGVGIFIIVLLLLVIIGLLILGLIRRRNRNIKKENRSKAFSSLKKPDVVILSTEMFEKLQYGSKKTRPYCLNQSALNEDDDAVYRPCSTVTCNCQYCLLPIDIESTAQTAMIDPLNKENH